MRLDRLQLDLRPRPHTQALDLGFTLLHANTLHVYLAWLGLWLPLVAVCTVVDLLLAEPVGLAVWLPWWLKPLLERAPLYVLSRQVFGERVTGWQALRAWPRQLGGGWIRLLTVWRLFMPGRGLFQPIWQLEGARGQTAAQRIAAMRRGGAGHGAFWFGVACAHLELILQLGLLAFLGLFLTSDGDMNPFAVLLEIDPEDKGLLFALYACSALGGALMGPIYIACCFTLYLNRRATMEAWDLEIRLRQLKRPARKAAAPLKLLAAVPLLVLATFGPVPRAEAAAPKSCGEDYPLDATASAAAARTPEQQRLRRDLEALYRGDELRRFRCAEERRPKQKKEEKKTEPKQDRERSPRSRNDAAYLNTAASTLEVVLIASALALVAWLLYRYRGPLGRMVGRTGPRQATEVAGLDIRPESLPDDVAGQTLALWQRERRREALALLYRATLARLVGDDGLIIAQGATEGDCLRLAAQAQRSGRLSAARFEVAECATGLWRRAAYGGRWPETDELVRACELWRERFDGGGGRA